MHIIWKGHFVTMLLCLSTLLLVAHHAAVAIPQRPSHRGATEEELDSAASLRENFDPSQANSHQNISCVGGHYALTLPEQQDWNPNERTMQQICAKPQYNGGPPGQHVGGWCDHGEVVFDDSPEAQINTQLASPRILLGCRYRCFCNHGIPVEDRATQPKPSEHQTALQLVRGGRESFLTYEIRLDVQDDFTMPSSYNQGSFGEREVEVVRLSHLQEVRHPESLQTRHYEYVSEDQGNKITCSGDLPSFQLPPPYSVTPPHSDFQNNQQLCAVQLNGGLLGANAGGYCHRSDRLDPTGSFFLQTVSFADEMTPRLDWTWRGGLLSASASIRLHCKLNCRCSSGQTEFAAHAWQFTQGYQLRLLDSGQIDLESLDNGPSGSADISGSGQPPAKRPKTSQTLMTILPRQDTGGGGSSNRSRATTGTGASGSCGPDGRQFCPQQWPTSLLGPVPSAPPDATELLRSSSSDDEAQHPPAKGAAKAKTQTADLTVCGNKCQGPQDCASPATGNNETDHSCVCAFPNAQDAKWLGLDPVMPVSVCLVLMSAAFGHKAQVSGGNLNGRDVLGIREGEGKRMGEEWLCRCNATFTHNLCCGSRDGMVWLD